MEEVIAIRLKDPKTFEEQLSILEKRSMIINDRDAALEILKITNYYRLTAYALQFKKADNYNKQTSFDNVYKLYMFDKKLRHLILEILESIEIALRTYMAYHLSIKYGTEAHLKSDLFKNLDMYNGYSGTEGSWHKGLKDEIKSEIHKNRKELFVKHHLKKYAGRFPIWVLIEIFSFGMLSRTYANLNIVDQKEIARKCFNINYQLLESWLNNLSYIRNICAHYGRLYNKHMAILPKLHTKYNANNIDRNRLFISILAIKELTIDSLEWVTFRTQLELLIGEYIDVLDLSLIGFPKDWAEILLKN